MHPVPDLVASNPTAPQMAQVLVKDPESQ